MASASAQQKNKTTTQVNKHKQSNKQTGQHHHYNGRQQKFPGQVSRNKSLSQEGHARKADHPLLAGCISDDLQNE
eukprot:scaffold48541_cov63-Cyclotella_meneghiniana.AAC.1